MIGGELKMSDLKREIAGLKQERDAALEREQALAAHVERMTTEMKRCMSLLHCHFPSSDKDAAFYAAKKCVEDAPEASLTYRDLIKQSDELERLYRIANRQYKNGAIPLRDVLDRALELRRQAEGVANE